MNLFLVNPVSTMIFNMVFVFNVIINVNNVQVFKSVFHVKGKNKLFFYISKKIKFY
jgi:hypothetical protein